MKMSTRTVENPKVVSREEWLVARKKLLAKEKQLTRQRDAIAAERRQLPWGQSRKELCLRFAKRQENASRPLRRPKPADRVPLHVWPGVAGGLPQLLLQHGSHGRRTCASGATRRLLGRCFPGADFQNRSL